MKAMKRIYYIAIVSLAFAACARNEIPLVKLGAAQKEFLVEADGGNVNIPVYSNGEYHIERLTEDSDWLTLEMPAKHSENGYIKAQCDFNKSFRRQVVFLLCSDVDSRKDTILFRQKGLLEPALAMDNRAMQVKGAGGSDTHVIRTNIHSDDLVKTITYSSDTDPQWITAMTIDDSVEDLARTLTVTADPNPDPEHPRVASVRFDFKDGWGEKLSLTFNVIQRSSQEKIGTEVSMEELKYERVESGKTFEEFLIVKGIVVSDKTWRNCGDNEQVTTSQIDYSLDQRTIYLESLDGKQGICLITATEEDNVTSLYNKVEVLLYGTNPVLYDDPSYLVVNDVTSAMFISNEAGESYEVPSKSKYIGDLTDDDIFTRVTLRDVEIPVRKGNIMPVNEGYTLSSGGNRLTKYPRLIRDINGDDMYMYINSTCLWRMHGDPLTPGGLPETVPYGSGSITGVLVHERYPRFEWANGADPMDLEGSPTLGYIGKYQIRPQHKGDVWDNMNMSVEDSFSKLLCEYRYWRPDRERGVCLPTYGNNGWFTHTYQTKYTGNSSLNYTRSDGTNQHMNGGFTYDYLGPKGKSEKYLFGYHPGNINGLGILIDREKEFWDDQMSQQLMDFTTLPVPQWCGPGAPSPICQYVRGQYNNSINYYSASNEGKGLVHQDSFSSFASGFWWNDVTGKPYGWLLNFSTQGISASHISLQIAVLNTGQSLYAPRFWKLEWNTTDDQNSSGWTEIAQYTVPDVSIWSNTLYHSIVGAKHINFELPLEILGKPNVYLRMVPASDLCSSGADYADARLSDGPNPIPSGTTPDQLHENCISYIAIRYN